MAGPALDVVDRCIYFISKKDRYRINRYNYSSGECTVLTKLTADAADECARSIISMTFDSVGRKLYWANNRGRTTGLFLYSYDVTESGAIPVKAHNQSICEQVFLEPNNVVNSEGFPCNTDAELGAIRCPLLSRGHFKHRHVSGDFIWC